MTSDETRILTVSRGKGAQVIKKISKIKVEGKSRNGDERPDGLARSDSEEEKKMKKKFLPCSFKFFLLIFRSASLDNTKVLFSYQLRGRRPPSLGLG